MPNNLPHNFTHTLPSKVPSRLSLLALLGISGITFLLAIAIRFEFRLTVEDARIFLLTFPVLAVFRLLGFTYFEINRRSPSNTSFADVLPLTASVLLPSLLFGLTCWTLLAPIGLSRAAILIDSMLMLIATLVFFSLPRISGIVREEAKTQRDRTLVVLGKDPVTNLKAVLDDPRFHPVGFVAMEPLAPGTRILGVPYVGLTVNTIEAARKHGASLIAITYPSLDQHELLQLTRATMDAGLEYVLLRSGRRNKYLSTPLVEEVGIEVLLQREEIGINYDQLRHFIEGRPVLVTGAGGSIGGELCRQLAALKPSRLYLLEHSENSLFFILRELKEKFPDAELHPLLVDITDGKTLKAEFLKARPELVFHAAAHKHVGMMEGRPQAALRNNLLGTANVALAAAECGVDRMINISTDKAVRPMSFMGLSKRLAEMVIAEMNNHYGTHFVTVRFGNVAGSNGSVVQLFDQQLRRNGPLTVTDKTATRFFMSIPEAVRLVLQAGAFAETGGVYMLDMGTPVNIYELACTMIRLGGQRPGKDIAIRFTGLTTAEKMHEELNDDGEILSPTSHSRILGISPEDSHKRPSILERLPRWRERLADGDNAPVFRELPEVWPLTTQLELPLYLTNPEQAKAAIEPTAIKGATK
jgi:FlaA1/EpsC-like NDP-sugar epimerase